MASLTLKLKKRAGITALKQLLYRKRRGAKYHPQVGAIIIAGENRFQVRIDNLPKTDAPFVNILKGSDYRLISTGCDLVGGYIIVERLVDG